jgi:hypothetical protein
MSSKRCAMECGRPVTSDSPEGQLCVPCLQEAEWENVHSDNGHDEDIDQLTLGQTNLKTKKALEAYKAEVKAQQVDCWICHPELNKAQESYAQRAGTSRQGIVLTVPPKATAKDKALFVAEKIDGAKVRTVKGVTTLKAENVTLVWDGRGRFQSAGSLVNGKKVRNVSEALRVLAA